MSGSEAPTWASSVWSLAFGVGHLLQGYDVAIATALMGAFWAIVYVRRRSVVAPVVSHSGFNLLELAQYLAMTCRCFGAIGDR